MSDLIGNTPLLALPLKSTCARVLLKMESFNPTGTAKIRMAKQMIDDAEARGQLKPGGKIVESTSGNTGLGLAMIAAERGYEFTAVVDQHASKDKLYAMQAMGAKLHYVGEHDGLATADRDATAERIARECGAYWTEQHNNPANANAYTQLANELYDSLGNKIDYLIGAVGTGGSLCGTARALKSYLPQLQVVGVEPLGSIIFGEDEQHDYYQSGTGTPRGAEIGELIDYQLIDIAKKVSDKQAFETARYLAKHHGIFVGGSAGGVIYQALQLAQTLPENETMVVLVCDGGEKYIHTIFNDVWMKDKNLLDSSITRKLTQLLD
ncbi:PLP-dependent cysteine synthase family protein [Acinetobacter sp. ESBL14]|uniref:PLP-dependent cysteine synthase family protein n=1 Tax=Acinetobacter sp. ESBL14 TaxID=3077329 RepID=UPI002FC85714